MAKTAGKKGKGPDKGPPKKKETVIKKKVKVVKERIRENGPWNTKCLSVV